MTNDTPSELIKATAELAKAVPVYQDAIQPAAKQIGMALETAGRTLNVALSPIKGLVWSWEQLQAFLSSRVAPKLAYTPKDQVVTPKINVVAPALEAVRFAEEEPDLQEMYANLIATAMDDRVRARVLPAFVDILKQLTSDEAKILRIISEGHPVPIVHLRLVAPNQQQGIRLTGIGPGTTFATNLSLIGQEAGCEFPGVVQSYIDNLARLGIIALWEPGRTFTDATRYEKLESDPEIVKLKTSWDSPERVGILIRSGFEVTALGRAFMDACVVPYEKRATEMTSAAETQEEKA